MAVDGKLQQVRQHFERKGIRLDSDWLNGCVEFFIDENPSISINQLCQQAEEQWELSDLSDSGIKCLPDSIFARKDIQTINGTFPLQIQFLLDISESPYDQLQRLQNKETEVANEQPEFNQTKKIEKGKKKRMLKLDLSDGFRTVSALEYTPIPCLNAQLAPGLKVIVTGPLRCVNHILFLEAKNIRILGGEVTTLAIENAYENVLRKQLSLAINPNPINDYQEPAADVTTMMTIRTDNIPSIPMTATNTATQPSSTRNHNTFDDFLDDDVDLLTDIDVDLITANVVTTPTKSSTTIQNQNDIPLHRQSTLLFDDDDVFSNIDPAIDQLNISTTPPPPPSPQPETSIQNSEVEFSVPQLPADEPEIHADNYRFKIRGLNLVTIKQISECSAENRKRRKYFIVKARIEKIVKQARVAQMRWKLGVLLADLLSDNVTLSVSFSNDVLEKLADISGRELHQMYTMRNERPQFQTELDAILKSLGEKLEEMYTFMKIDFDVSGSDLPVVVELINAAPVLNRKLQDKIEYERLQ
ncbi:recQ-mediated genome instability protein 1-like [Contarinia nasturtii]|uniref:recQ-mediated genome instability protein 1-like n=1 Tax=Contarinia nasturtii TaxID=265458 RepID=UPI0012D4992A|nr:recQ-mediated genome instability protein 1-like [Contarinia nasturtii]